MAEIERISAFGETTSPGGGREPVAGHTTLRELPWCGKINLRGDANDAQFVEAARAALGVPLPLAANTTASGDGMTIFWLGPDEWLLHCALERAQELRRQLTQALGGIHHAATEVTDYYTVLELQGEAAAAALARGCPLDLHENVFPAGQCAQTRFGNASVLLYKPEAAPCFAIQVRWSFTEYVWDYLVSALDCLPPD